MGRGKDAACSQNLGLGTVTAAGHRTIPITKCDPAHNVNSVEVEKRCLLPLRRQRVKFSHGGCGPSCSRISALPRTRLIPGKSLSSSGPRVKGAKDCRPASLAH